MTEFDARERGYEAKFEHDQEVAFRLKARRNHLLGRWAAAQLGLEGAAAEAYARDIADPSRHLHGDKDIIAGIAADFAAKRVALDATRVALELAHFGLQAEKQLRAQA